MIQRHRGPVVSAFSFQAIFSQTENPFSRSNNLKARRMSFASSFSFPSTLPLHRPQLSLSNPSLSRNIGTKINPYHCKLSLHYSSRPRFYVAVGGDGDSSELSSSSSGIGKVFTTIGSFFVPYGYMLTGVTSNIAKNDPLKYLFLFPIINLWVKYLVSMTIVAVKEKNGSVNEIFECADIYLCNKIMKESKRLKAFKNPDKKDYKYSREKEEIMEDEFNGIKLTWLFNEEEKKFGVLCRKKDEDMVKNEYIPFVVKRAKEIRAENFSPKFYFIDEEEKIRDWECDNLDHSLTFDNLAMEPEMKESIITNLDKFLMMRGDLQESKGRKFWEKRYVLSGPRGTGKSSFIEAISNYVKFDVYELQLKEVSSYSELRRILLSTTNKSIIVINDIDYMLEGSSGVELTALIKLMKKLPYKCGDGRILIFTMNCSHKINCAPLGNINMQFQLPYCTPRIFSDLMFTHLRISDHRLFDEIKGMLMEGVQVTNAEIVDYFMGNDDVNIEVKLEGLVGLLKRKRMVGAELGENLETSKGKPSAGNADRLENPQSGDFPSNNDGALGPVAFFHSDIPPPVLMHVPGAGLVQ